MIQNKPIKKKKKKKKKRKNITEHKKKRLWIPFTTYAVLQNLGHHDRYLLQKARQNVWLFFAW